MNDTIFALSSGVVKSGVSVYRISGEESLKILQRLTKNTSHVIPKRVSMANIYDVRNNLLIDKALVVFFKKPYSFTGEDVVEIYTHGSIAIMKIMYQVLPSFENVRLAKHGEFALRAFYNSKFDLTAAEGLADLIESDTIEQHKQAIRQSTGALSDLYHDWRKQLLSIISYLEAYIDFPDEEIPHDLVHNIDNKVNTLKKDMESHIDNSNDGEILKNGIRVTIIGAPNVGKSSLINYLSTHDVSIVSDIPGTTRDVIETTIDINGYPIIIQDTAGIRTKSIDPIEQIGINKAFDKAKNSLLRIFLFSTDIFTEQDVQNISSLFVENDIILLNKVDLHQPQISTISNMISSCLSSDIIHVSIKNNINLEKITDAITKFAKDKLPDNDSIPFTKQRHKSLIRSALLHLKNFNLEKELVLNAEDIRVCIQYLENLTGVIKVDDIIGEIFSNFCIGK